MDTNLTTYYAERAAVYEQIYHKPERQADLTRLHHLLPPLFAERTVLEIACGTGYWTPVIAQTAQSVLATDINEPVLDLARAKPNLPETLRFLQADAFTLDNIHGPFDAAFAGFWWSHLALDAIPAFLDNLHRHLAPGARVVLVDNRYVPGSSTAIARTDAGGNTYQQRKLPSGETYEVRKNFPTEFDLRTQLAPWQATLTYTALPYYWLCVYELAP